MKKIIIFLILLLIVGCAQESVQDLDNQNNIDKEGQIGANDADSVDIDTNNEDTKAVDEISNPLEAIEETPKVVEEVPKVVENTPEVIEDITKTEPINPIEEEAKLLKPAEIKDYIDVSLIAGNVNRGIIDPATVTIKVGQTVRWTNRNVRKHLMNCKYEFKQVFKGISIAPEEYSEFVFEKAGEYTCLDALYGARSTVIVE